MMIPDHLTRGLEFGIEAFGGDDTQRQGGVGVVEGDVMAKIATACCLVCEGSPLHHGRGAQCGHFCHVPLEPLPERQALGQSGHCPRCQERQPVRVVGMAQAGDVPVECKTCGVGFTVKYWEGDEDDD